MQKTTEQNYIICRDILRPYVKDKLMGAVFRHAIEKATNDNLLFFEEDAGKIIGFILLRKRKKDNTMVLEKIAVDENYKKNGYGKKLLQKALDACVGCVRIELGVVSKNSNAIEFYKKNGFVETGVKTMGKNKDILLTMMEHILWVTWICTTMKKAKHQHKM